MVTSPTTLQIEEWLRKYIPTYGWWSGWLDLAMGIVSRGFVRVAWWPALRKWV